LNAGVREVQVELGWVPGRQLVLGVIEWAVKVRRLVARGVLRSIWIGESYAELIELAGEIDQLVARKISFGSEFYSERDRPRLFWRACFRRRGIGKVELHVQLEAGGPWQWRRPRDRISVRVWLG
jgi:hypothetical protein